MSFSIPNTTTTADYKDATFAGNDVFGSGFFTIANNAAFVRLLHGAYGQSHPGPETFLPPGTYPILGTRTDPISGIQFKDASSGVHAQVFGTIYYPNESSILSGNQFNSTVSPTGSVTPPSTGAMELFSELDLSINPTWSGIPQTGRHLRIEAQLRSSLASVNDGLFLAFNFDGSTSYLWQFTAAVAAGVSAADGGALVTNARIGRIPAATAPASFWGTVVVDIPYYATSNFKAGSSQAASPVAAGASGLALESNVFVYLKVNGITSITMQTSAAFVATSKASLYIIN